ncbi:MAG: helix-turn-helix domain-containing protein [Oscillospiraceae bacterium]|nr:helix-turn-helix domain-containing protein [Oscillospiraceae bacterium]
MSYYTIYDWMSKDLELKGNNLLTYAVIYGFSHDGAGECYGSLTYLSDLINCTKQTIVNVLKALEKKNLIIKYQTRDADGGLRNHYKANLDLLISKKIQENSKQAEEPKNFTQSDKIFECPPVKKFECPSQKTRPNSNNRYYNSGFIEREETQTPPKEHTNKKEIYGDFNNVYLSRKEYDKLYQLFGEQFGFSLANFSGFMEYSGKHYYNHFARLLQWCKEDVMRNKKSYDYKKAKKPEEQNEYAEFVNNWNDDKSDEYACFFNHFDEEAELNNSTTSQPITDKSENTDNDNEKSDDSFYKETRELFPETKDLTNAEIDIWCENYKNYTKESEREEKEKNKLKKSSVDYESLPPDLCKLARAYAEKKPIFIN